MSYKHFTSDERLEISILLKRGYSRREIGTALGKNHSSVSREIKNNSVQGVYEPIKAQQKAIFKRSNSKYQGMKIRLNPKIENFVRDKMQSYWSPEQITGRWNKDHRDENEIIISPLIIYKYLYSPYGQDLCSYLYSRRYKKKRRKAKKQKKELIKNRIFIEKRAKIINERKRIGDLEGDTLGTRKNDKASIAGLVDRKSRYFMAKKISRLKYTMDGFKNILNPYQNIFHSLTLDNGVENVRYQELKIKTYFCRPYSAWQKPTIENTFQRLRRFIPKKSSLKLFSNNDLQRFAKIMNQTPRKCLKWQTPDEVFTKNLCKFDPS